MAGCGQVDIESKIDDVRQQIRKSEISKMKAKARLQVIRESAYMCACILDLYSLYFCITGGAEVDDFDAFECQVTQEIKQQSLDVEMNINALSRTPSMRSNMGSAESKSPGYVMKLDS